MIRYICKQCGNVFYDWPCHNRKYCCKRCQWDGQIGVALPRETVQKIIDGNKGKKRTLLAKARYRAAKLGEKNPLFGVPSCNKGKKFPGQVRRKRGE